jgi:hypothetical protein
MNVRLIYLVTPLLSLTGGALTLVLFRRGAGFAPVSLAIATVAWIAAILFARIFIGTLPGDASNKPEKRNRLWRFASQAVVMSLYQTVLFFLLPIWFGSAVLSSVNVFFPVFLSAIALFACFDDHFTKWVIAYPVRRTLASAVLFFSASVPALSLTQMVPLRLGVGLCAGAAAFIAVCLGLSGIRWIKRTVLSVFVALACATLFYLISPLLPPVPVQCVTQVAATGIDDERTPVGIANLFPKSVQKIYVYFAVAAPEEFEQKVRFQWYLNGEQSGKPLSSSVVGGRIRGFRTWTFRNNPQPGRYQVDLETDEGQLVGRVDFSVISKIGTGL